MKKTLIAIIALLAASGFTAFAEDAAAPKDKPKHERKTFEQVDTDKDGKISLDEFKAALSKLDPAKAEEIFKKKDTDANGSLSKEEYEKHGEHKKDGGGDKPK